MTNIIPLFDAGPAFKHALPAPETLAAFHRLKAGTSIYLNFWEWSDPFRKHVTSEVKFCSDEREAREDAKDTPYLFGFSARVGNYLCTLRTNIDGSQEWIDLSPEESP